MKEIFYWLSIFGNSAFSQNSTSFGRLNTHLIDRVDPVNGGFRPIRPFPTKKEESPIEEKEIEKKVKGNAKKETKVKAEKGKSRQLPKLIKLFDSKFQASKYFNYGCNCYLNNNDFDQPGYGESIDELDQNCKKYKECLQDAKNEYGDDCGPQTKPYR